MGPQGLEGLLRTVRRRGQAVGPQADPCQDGDQGYLVEDGGFVDVPGSADEPLQDPLAEVSGLGGLIRFHGLNATGSEDYSIGFST